MSKEIDEHVLELYEVKKLLGSGAYGHVWRVIEKTTKKEYALKKIFDAFQNAVDAQRTYRQITVLHQLDHNNIIKLKQVIKAQNNKDLYLVFEYMETDLHSLVGEDVLQLVHIKFVIYQILKALKYLHSAQLIHRDLKPSNILINSECEIKVCDFGLVRSLTHQEDQVMILSQEVATRWYRSPQILLGSKKYSKPTDIWSVGCIIAEIIMGKPIFPGTSTLNQLEMIIQFTGAPSQESIDSLQSQLADSLINQLSFRKKSIKDYFQPGTDQDLIRLITSMLQFNPSKRITIQEAMNLPIFQQFCTSQQQELCTKIIFPQVDDNVRLTVNKYRQIIYKDIDRRYPNTYSLNNQITPIKFKRNYHHSLTRHNQQSNHQSKNSNQSLNNKHIISNTNSFYKVKPKESPQNYPNQIKYTNNFHLRNQNNHQTAKLQPKNYIHQNICHETLPKMRPKKLLHKSTMTKTTQVLMQFKNKISKLRN